MPLLSKKKARSDVSIEIPVLCKFWREDQVWNGIAEDIPVAIYGATFEQAQQHMQDAILGDLESLQQLNRLRETINLSAQEVSGAQSVRGRNSAEPIACPHVRNFAQQPALALI